MDLKFRDLNAKEIELRVGSTSKSGTGFSLLLYKTARVDSAILDETVGVMNWSNEYKEIKGNMYCGITIYDRENNIQITKWNCGKETHNESEKGEASDAFKRAGFTWGIGVELYTAPFVWITSDKGDVKDNFEVEKIVIENKEIVGLSIKNASTGKRVYVWQKQQ